MTFETDFAGMLPELLVYISATKDETGELTATGSSTSISCYIEEETELIMDRTGKEVVSTVQVFVGNIGLTVDAHLYTLPSRFPVNAQREAIGIEHISSEDGAYSEILMF